MKKAEKIITIDLSIRNKNVKRTEDKETMQNEASLNRLPAIGFPSIGSPNTYKKKYMELKGHMV